MKIDHLQLKNFKPYRDLQLNFKEGVIIIYGPNGSGKSTLLDACFFALYGKVSARGKLEEIITKGEAKTQVNLIFSQGENSFNIEREITMRGGAAITTKCTLKTPTEIISGSGMVGKEIEKILGMSHDEFLNCAYVRQGEINKLIDATPSERQRFIDELLQLGLLKKYEDRISKARLSIVEMASEQKGAIEELNNQLGKKDQSDLSKEIEHLEENEIKINTEIKKLNESSDQRRNAIIKLEKIIESHGEIKDEIKNLGINIKRNSEELVASKKAFSKNNEEMANERNGIQEEIKKGRILEEEIDNIILRSETEIQYKLGSLELIEDLLNNLKIEIKASENEIGKMEKLIQEGKCPECGKEIEGAPRIASLEKEREDLSEKIILFEGLNKEWIECKELSQKIGDYNKVSVEVRRRGDQLNRLESSGKIIKGGIQVKQELLLENQTRLKKLEMESGEDGEIETIEMEKKSVEKELETIKKDLGSLEVKREKVNLEKVQKKLERIEIKDLKERIKTLEKDKSDIELIIDESEKLKSYYGMLRVELRQKNLTRLEILLNEMFQTIYQNDAYDQIELDESYDLLVYQKDGEFLNPRQLSGGERALFNLSLRSAIYRLLIEGSRGVIPMPPLILDEPTVFLDEGHVGKLSDLIESMQNIGVEQILIVSHDEELLDAGGSVIVVGKESTTNRSEVTLI